MKTDKRLTALAASSRRFRSADLAFRWLALIGEIFFLFEISRLFEALLVNPAMMPPLWLVLSSAIVFGGLRILSAKRSAIYSQRSAQQVKQELRGRIFDKLGRLGPSYMESVSTAELVQLASEGVEQLELYFGAYIVQFRYALLTPIVLFATLAFFSPLSALVLLLCVPLIPMTMAMIGKRAKRKLGNYWNRYASLGERFLENLQGLTTLKIYDSDALRHEQMNREAESFRVATMRVLTMQLQSITFMDLIAYGGAALGSGVAIGQYALGRLSLSGCLLIILLAAEFFLPLRRLGSLFHAAMNGIAASERIFNFLDLPENPDGAIDAFPAGEVKIRDLDFAYTPDRPVLRHLSIEIPRRGMTALVGESGCGKSTIAALLCGRRRAADATIFIGGHDINTLSHDTLLHSVTYVGNNAYIFKGSVRDNLRIGCHDATEADMWQALEAARLADFVRDEGGLDLPLTEHAGNLSGGQRQRLAMARALLHDSPVYIFDESTSNIDVESENAILEQIHHLATQKCVIFISHRLAAGQDAGQIYVLDKGSIAGHGRHDELLRDCSVYKRLWDAQQELEAFGGEGETQA